MSFKDLFIMVSIAGLIVALDYFARPPRHRGDEDEITGAGGAA